MSRYTPMPPQNFGGLPEEFSAYETTRPMELYDEELELDPSREIGIATWPPIDTQDGTFEEVLRELFTAQLELLVAGKFPVALGGEHSLTPPLVSATLKNSKTSACCTSARTPKCAMNIRATPAAMSAPCAASWKCAPPCRWACARSPRKNPKSSPSCRRKCTGRKTSCAPR